MPGKSSCSSAFRPEADTAALLAVLLGATGCGGNPGDPGDPVPRDSLPATIAVEIVAGGLSSPLYLTAPSNDPRLFVVEQPGRIRIVENGQLRTAPFMDITGRVLDGGERGLLSVAFHPNYAANGFFYVNYTDNAGDTRVERYRVSADPYRGDTTTAMLVLAIDQPFANHNGGHQVFGPDGMLWIGTGDGGSGGDPQRNGQNLNALLGKMLRINVDAGSPYSIPPDNPFVGRTDARGEVWALGLRNPWRFAFDRVDDVLYIADVGQNQWEEVDAVSRTTAGVNYGWNVMEASQCFGSGMCNRTGLTLPVVEYGHSDGCSITGGVVYRGQRIPGLVGHYFYSDYCSGWLRSFRYQAGQVSDRREWSVGPLGQVQSFGEDAAGELYILSRNGNVYRLVPAG
ncbi:MAG: PQQ-dependent sugar dehydrogenase [Gemmatimonadetes bacterium]|nr:PQQ-dependent sugar dehydrogenase [Gemmatimonadota bacterium]